MHKHRYLITLLAASFLFIAGCQNVNGPSSPGAPLGFLQPQSNDERITNAILESMLNNEVVSNIKVRVQTTDGVVMLSGYVKTIRQSDVSEEIARRTPGVKSVQNNIIVRK
jgi:osmotically-inducible protein OsmY